MPIEEMMILLVIMSKTTSGIAGKIKAETSGTETLRQAKKKELQEKREGKSY